MRAATVVLAIAWALAACGSDDSKSDGKEGSGAGATASQRRAGADAPRGELNAGEYRLMLRAARAVEGAGDAKDFRATLARFKSACRILREAPTPLMRANQDGCEGEAAMLSALVAFGRHARSCGEQQPSGTTTEPASFTAADPNCLARDLDEIAKNARDTLAAGVKANREADARGIRGRCLRVVGMPADDVRSVTKLAESAEAFSSALRSGNPSAVTRASEQFKVALDALAGGSDENLVKLVRTCRS